MKLIRGLIALLLVLLTWLSDPAAAWAFCGFYVAKADTKLYNQASQVVLARSGDRTVLTMANDYQGEVQDFAIVVPVPTMLKQDQVRVGDAKIIERLDAFSAPRLVEYFDTNPCATPERLPMAAPSAVSQEAVGNRAAADAARSLGVTIEQRFTVGEYDILILSAKESSGLERWLTQNGYKIPAGAKALLQPYIRQNLKFFVAKVNLQEYAKSNYQNLRPLMMAYESPKFMLPIRLGMVNAATEQDLIVYLLSPKGQVELTNYRTVKVPSDLELPVFVKQEFNDFYKAMFKTSYDREGRKVAFVEYAWNMGNCDPCSAEPLTPKELRQAGVFWLDSSPQDTNTNWFAPSRSEVFITRLHVRYTRDKFPEDLMFQETSNQQQFQGRYVLRHPFSGRLSCPEGRRYQQALARRQEKETQTLARLTGWNIQDIRKKAPVAQPVSTPWWRTLWP